MTEAASTVDTVSSEVSSVKQNIKDLDTQKKELLKAIESATKKQDTDAKDIKDAKDKTPNISESDVDE